MTRVNSVKKDQEETADGYARNHHCFHDHREAPFRFHDQINKIRKTALPVQQDGFVQQHGLHNGGLSFPDSTFESEEFQQPSRSPSAFLDDMTSESDTFLHLSQSDYPYLPRECLDLGYHMEEDMIEYQLEVQKKQVCSLSNEWLPLCSMGIEKDEGMEFPTTSSRWQSLALRELECESIEISDKNTDLARTTNDLITDPHHTIQLTKEELGLRRPSNSYPDLVSPPLSPASEDDSLYNAFVPRDEVAIIDLTSEPSSPVNTAADNLQRDCEKGCLDSEPVAPSSLPSSPPPSNLPKIPPMDTDSTLASKIEVPIVPSTSPPVESGDLLVGIIDLAPSGVEDFGLEVSNDNGFFDEALMEIIKDRHYRTLQMAEGERLDYTGPVLRMKVPSLNFDIAPVEWILHISSAGAHFTWLHERYKEIFQLDKRVSLSNLESTLKWTPIPSGSGRISVNEKCDKLSEESRKYFMLEQPQLSSTSYIIRGLSPRIFRALDDTEIEEMSVPMEEGNFVSSLNTSAQDNDAQIFKPDCQLESLLSNGLASVMKPRNEKSLSGTASLLPNSGDSEATSKLLSSFMELRHAKKAKLTIESAKDNKKAPRTVHSDLSVKQLRPMQNHDVTAELLREAAVPEIIVPQDKCRFIVSLSLNRVVLTYVEQLWPQAELIDRDFTQYNTIIWSPGSAQRREVISDLSHEADILLSPSTGIIVTNLLKVKQRPLPGSNQLTSLRSRVEQVSQKYESLFIFVSEANPAGEYVGNPSPSDLAAYADFVQFTLMLQAGISVYFVSGGEETLSKWTVSLMCRFSHQNSGFAHLLQQGDSTWDMFFRRAGMNVFAAQVLSGVLLAEYGNLGLAQFFAMSTEERVSKYFQMMGGNRVLRRICRLLDQEWM